MDRTKITKFAKSSNKLKSRKQNCIRREQVSLSRSANFINDGNDKTEIRTRVTMAKRAFDNGRWYKFNECNSLSVFNQRPYNKITCTFILRFYRHLVFYRNCRFKKMKTQNLKNSKIILVFVIRFSFCFFHPTLKFTRNNNYKKMIYYTVFNFTCFTARMRTAYGFSMLWRRIRFPFSA